MSLLPPDRSGPRALAPTGAACILLALALTSCGGDPAPAPGSVPGGAAGAPWFEEQARQRGLVWEHRSGHETEFLYPELIGGGAALFDMDGDGDLDVFLAQSGSLVHPDAPTEHGLFRNRGDGTFEDVSAAHGVHLHGYGQGVTHGDYDGDGDLDLYVLNLGPNLLLRNDGSGRFEDVTDTAGVGDAGWGASACFFDMDLDGDLDLFVGNYIDWTPELERPCFGPTGRPDYCGPSVYDAPARDTLYRNEGDGTFTDVSEQSGIRAAFGNALGVVAGDFDGDGRTDLFVANDMLADQLWINRGEGRFEDLAPVLGVAVDPFGRPRAGMGVDSADIDEDGDLDLLVVHLAGESDGLFRNEGSYFSEATPQAGMSKANRMRTRFGVGLHDFDLDGMLDVYQANGRVNLLQVPILDEAPYAEPNTLMRGVALGVWEEVRPSGGTAVEVLATSRGAAFGDLDGDGAMDVVVVNRDGPVHLMHNVTRERGSWLMARVVDEAGRTAVGASVTFRLGERRVRREVRPAYSYASSSDDRVHLGLGGAARVDEATVRWPGGTLERFGPLEANRVVTLRRGEGREE